MATGGRDDKTTTSGKIAETATSAKISERATSGLNTKTATEGEVPNRPLDVKTATGSQNSRQPLVALKLQNDN